MALVVKNLPANAGDIRDMGSIPKLRRSPGVGNGNPLQYSCLENPMDRGAWWPYTPQGYKESDMTEATKHRQRIHYTLYDSGRKFSQAFTWVVTNNTYIPGASLVAKLCPTLWTL